MHRAATSGRRPAGSGTRTGRTRLAKRSLTRQVRTRSGSGWPTAAAGRPRRSTASATQNITQSEVGATRSMAPDPIWWVSQSMNRSQSCTGGHRRHAVAWRESRPAAPGSRAARHDGHAGAPERSDERQPRRQVDVEHRDVAVGLRIEHVSERHAVPSRHEPARYRGEVQASSSATPAHLPGGRWASRRGAGGNRTPVHQPVDEPATTIPDSGAIAAPPAGRMTTSPCDQVVRARSFPGVSRLSGRQWSFSPSSPASVAGLRETGPVRHFCSRCLCAHLRSGGESELLIGNSFGCPV